MEAGTEELQTVVFLLTFFFASKLNVFGLFESGPSYFGASSIVNDKIAVKSKNPKTPTRIKASRFAGWISKLFVLDPAVMSMHDEL
jgi:hypothetical protein